MSKKVDPLSVLNFAFVPLDKLNYYLMQVNLTQGSPRHVVVSQLWMLQNRLEGEWDRIKLHQGPKARKFMSRALEGLKQLQSLMPSTSKDKVLCSDSKKTDVTESKAAANNK